MFTYNDIKGVYIVYRHRPKLSIIPPNVFSAHKEHLLAQEVDASHPSTTTKRSPLRNTVFFCLIGMSFVATETQPATIFTLLAAVRSKHELIVDY